MAEEHPHALITGGSSGIGLAIARQLADQGVNLTLVARGEDRLAAACKAVQQACQYPDQQVLTLSADVSQRPQAEWAVKEAIAQLGAPRWLITCAGMARPGYFQDIPIEIFEYTMAVNYFGTLYCIRAALPAMAQKGQGQVVIVSSGAGLVGLYGYSAYGASKFALQGLAESLRAELKPMGLGVSIAYPPDTDTPQLVEENKTKPPATKEMTAAAKVWSAEDVAKVVLQGVHRGQFAITPGTEITVLHRLHSLAAPLLNRYFDGIVARYPIPNAPPLE